MKLCLLLCLLPAVICGQTVREEVEHRANGLVYISESNSKLQVFEIEGACFLLPPHGLEFVPFFRAVIDRDVSGRWEDLIYYMDANLTNLKVYKIGHIQIDIYAVGCYRQSVIGLYFTAIET